MRLISANSLAIRILAYPKDPTTVTSLDGLAAKTIGWVASKKADGLVSSLGAEFVSGRRRYVCRAWRVDCGRKNASAPAVAVLLERERRGFALVTGIAEQFHLSRRERETVTLLVEGLTTNEIAGRMAVSPNTVKAFMRIVMTKMRVSNRYGIVGKILEQL